MGGGSILKMFKEVYKDDPDAISAIDETLSKNKKAKDDSDIDKGNIKEKLTIDDNYKSFLESISYETSIARVNQWTEYLKGLNKEYLKNNLKHINEVDRLFDVIDMLTIEGKNKSDILAIKEINDNIKKMSSDIKELISEGKDCAKDGKKKERNDFKDKLNHFAVKNFDYLRLNTEGRKHYYKRHVIGPLEKSEQLKILLSKQSKLFRENRAELRSVDAWNKTCDTTALYRYNVPGYGSGYLINISQDDAQKIKFNSGIWAFADPGQNFTIKDVLEWFTPKSGSKPTNWVKSYAGMAKALEAVRKKEREEMLSMIAIFLDNPDSPKLISKDKEKVTKSKRGELDKKTAAYISLFGAWVYCETQKNRNPGIRKLMIEYISSCKDDWTMAQIIMSCPFAPAGGIKNTYAIISGTDKRAGSKLSKMADKLFLSTMQIPPTEVNEDIEETIKKSIKFDLKHFCNNPLGTAGQEFSIKERYPNVILETNLAKILLKAMKDRIDIIKESIVNIMSNLKRPSPKSFQKTSTPFKYQMLAESGWKLPEQICPYLLIGFYNAIKEISKNNKSLIDYLSKESISIHDSENYGLPSTIPQDKTVENILNCDSGNKFFEKCKLLKKCVEKYIIMKIK